MKVKNSQSLINANEVYNLKKISSDEVSVLFVDEIYDGPLSGYCIWKNIYYLFYSFDQLYDDGDPNWPKKYILVSTDNDIVKLLHRYVDAPGFSDPKVLELIKKSFEVEKTINTQDIVGWFDISDKKNSKFLDSYQSINKVLF